jgi:hypothetical protein
MIQDRIGELRVRVRTNVPDATEIRPVTEEIVRAALERCAALLEERAPGRLVLVRHLPLRWACDESVFDDDAAVEELAQATVAAIERIAIPSSLDPPATREGAVVFDDEAHLRASHLLALSRGSTAWFYAALDDPAAGDPLAALAAPRRRATAHATLARLAGAGVLAEVLAVQSSSAVAVLAAALGCDAGQGPSAPDWSQDTKGRDAAVAELSAVTTGWPALTPGARSLALRVHAALLLDTNLEAPEAAALAAAVLDDTGCSPAPRVEPAAPDRGWASVDRATADEPVESTLLPTTRCAGLFYLCDRVQELDLAESLWKACLPEGAVLALAASALLGPAFAGDTALALFGGVDAAVKCPEVNSEQHEEIARATCAALAAALPRRGLAEIPPVVVGVVPHATGRLLVAAAEGSPFAFFAWPAAVPAMLSAGLRALLDAWSHRGEFTARPGLASLDTSGRLRPRRDAALAPLLLPEAPSAPAAALLALVAGAPCLLFAARAGAPGPDTADAFVARHLARPARIQLGPERMDVILSSSDVDLDVRRAGLDRDPGWLPWLRRTVRFIFEERDPVTNPPATVRDRGESR